VCAGRQSRRHLDSRFRRNDGQGGAALIPAVHPRARRGSAVQSWSRRTSNIELSHLFSAQHRSVRKARFLNQKVAKFALFPLIFALILAPFGTFFGQLSLILKDITASYVKKNSFLKENGISLTASEPKTWQGYRNARIAGMSFGFSKLEAIFEARDKKPMQVCMLFFLNDLIFTRGRKICTEGPRPSEEACSGLGTDVTGIPADTGMTVGDRPAAVSPHRHRYRCQRSAGRGQRLGLRRPLMLRYVNALVVDCQYTRQASKAQPFLSSRVTSVPIRASHSLRSAPRKARNPSSDAGCGTLAPSTRR